MRASRWILLAISILAAGIGLFFGWPALYLFGLGAVFGAAWMWFIADEDSP